MPGDEIATDDVAFQRYNATVESWGDRLYAAGARLCRFYQRLKMPGLVACPQEAAR